MKIGFLQFNATVGDIDGNAQRLIDGYKRLVSMGADCVIAPELAIPGYPPRDLVYKSRFVPDNLAALDRIARASGDVPFVLGYVDTWGGEAGNPFTNSAAVVQDGKVVAKIGKTRLPSYDIFDEARYFQPCPGQLPVEIAGKRVGITICEDIWTDDHLPSRLYDKDPALDAVNAGAELVFNLSASPYHLGKPARRREMLAGKARDLGVPIVYCNMVGGNDQLLFDGHSLVLSAGGVVTAALPGFVENETIVDIAAVVEAAAPVPQEEEEELRQALVLGLGDYVRKCGFKSVVLGLSGGIDSALVAALAVESLGPDNVHGVLMPGPFSSEHSLADATALARNLGIAHHTIPISSLYEQSLETLKPVFAGLPLDITEENIQARLRGLLLMAFSNKFGHLLLTTGNKSELAVGYCTIYGDMNGGLAVISDLPKTRVFSLAQHLNRKGEIIPANTLNKPPSAELRADQTDQDSLPPYDILDAILERYVEQYQSREEITAAGFDADLVEHLINLVDRNEWKRHQAAPGLRVTTRAFGSGRRIPIAQKFKQ